MYYSRRRQHLVQEDAVVLQKQIAWAQNWKLLLTLMLYSQGCTTQVPGRAKQMFLERKRAKT
jgi:hypothetical protein